MKRIIVLLFLIISLILFGCVSHEAEVQNTNLQDNSQEVQEIDIIDEEPIEEEMQVANPASVYCEEQEGILEIRTNIDGGQSGYCVFIDDETKEKSECEEWAYYRGECIIEDEEDIEDDNEGDEDDSSAGFASELEKGLPNTVPNEICKKLPLTNELNIGGRFYCFALVNHDAKFCEKIDDELDQVNICLAHAMGDPSYCKKIRSDAAKHVCYYMLAISSENIKFCDEITYDTHEKEQCYFSFVSNLYWFDKSDEITTEMCSHLSSPDDKTCLAFKDRDVSHCKNNVNCLTFFEQPMSFCTGKGSVLKDCLRDRAMSSKDISICEQLSGEKKDDCIGDFCTHIQLDTAICDKISNGIERQSRYVEVAMNLGNDVRGK